MNAEQMEEVEAAMEQETMEGTCDGRCTHCGYEETVEPDANYKCHECGKGIMQSVLVKHGLI